MNYKDIPVEPNIIPAYLAHVVFMTAKPDELVSWYQDVFHAKIIYSKPPLTFLTFDKEHHRFAIVALAEPQVRAEGSPPGFLHVAFSYDSVSDLMKTYERLKARGILPFAPINHGMTTSLYYADPDGNQIELQTDTFASYERAVAEFHSERFAANPTGYRYDADVLSSLIGRGVSLNDAMPEAERAANANASNLIAHERPS